MKIKVSVIIPVYNTEDYLKECIESLVNQTLREIEILIVNDGSTDSSLEIMKEFKNKYPNIIKIFDKVNGGQASARNYALPFAQGEYLGFVDSDDWVDSTMYEEMYEKAEKEDADIVICDMVDHFPDRTVCYPSSRFENKFKVTPSACNKLFKRSLVKEDVFPVGLWYEDFEFTTMQLMKTDCISVIHKGLYHCHCREVSTMYNNNSEKNQDILVVLEHLVEYVEKNGWYEKYKNVLEYLYIDHVLITSINRVQKQTNEKKKIVINNLRKEVLKRYNSFYKDDAFREMPKKRQIIALLNAYGLCSMSMMLLKITEIIKNNIRK
ncbi:glycosyltransferase family 2 protein [Blautia sp. BX19]|nr:glycosyltransferase family 2 protein [Blautia tarda]RHR16179.1 glycosyltransferase family 2 protein [Blautia sp. AF19-34]RHS50509.1 glycosyltransferase family 2 protein [Blautia sp. AM46-5]RHS56808.1 glycosyltransferase family 2 protein [Blautia sp. AM46-3MH]